MIISFLYPFPLRSIEAPFLWVYYCQTNYLNASEVEFILDDTYLQGNRYFKEKMRWENNPMFGYAVSDEKSSKYVKHVLDANKLDIIYKSYSNDLEFFCKYLTEEIPKLSDILYEVLKKILQEKKIEAVLSWSNCPSLDRVCKELGLTIIYNELGPLRSPNFINTAFFDFSGVNGNTSSSLRFKNFVNDYKNDKIELYETSMILSKIALADNILHDDAKEEFEYGVVLQVENDSNVIAYANGFDNLKLIDYVENITDSFLVRKHPQGLRDYSNLKYIDDSSNSLDFMRKCKNIISVNSGTMMEAILLNKNVVILGDSPYNIINDNDKFPEFSKNEFSKLVINFLAFNYVIPLDIMFSIDYLRFRLQEFSEYKINLFHRNLFNLNHQLYSEKTLFKHMCYQHRLVQLFYDIGDEFNPKHVIEAKFMDNQLIYEFDLSQINVPIKKLRFDPLNFPCRIELLDAYIYLDDGRLVALELDSFLNCYQLDQTIFQSFSPDPILFFKISNMRRSRIINVIIKMKINLLTFNDLTKHVEKFDLIIKEHDLLVNSISWKLTKPLRIISKLLKKIARFIL